MKNKLKFILPIGIALVAVLVLCLVLFLKKDEAYRSIKVYNIEGSAEVEREVIGVLNAYTGMMLQNEDDVTVETESYLYLQLDEDKYVLLEPGTKVHLLATGSSENSKTSIYLESGAIVSRLDNELSEESVYEVITPNSTMAVRGTIFRIEVTVNTEEESEAGTTMPTQTKVLVFEGKVDSKLIQPDGEISEETVQISANTSVTIEMTEVESEYVGEPIEVEMKEYEELNLEILGFLVEAVEEREEQGEEMEIPVEVIEEIKEIVEKWEPTPTPTATNTPAPTATNTPVPTPTNTPTPTPTNTPTPTPTNTPTPTPLPVYTVTFFYQTNTFATQEVEHGAYATMPTLLPALSGHWEFDFTKPITGNTSILWENE